MYSPKSLALIVLVTAGIITVASVGHAAAASQFLILEPFTQDEIDDNWQADRQFPSDGATSVSAFGRDNVLRIGIDSEETHDDTFRRTEGLKTVEIQDFGTAVQVDLFVDPDWESKAVRAGFWVVGDDGTGSRDNWFAIIDFVNSEPCPEDDCSNQSNITDHEGWRVWSSITDWTDIDADFAYGKWTTLGIELDTDSSEYLYYINGTLVGTAPGGEGSIGIGELFLNSYNFGKDSFPNLGSADYAAHWHAGLHPETRQDCMKGGWDEYGFSNQGQCIRFVNTGQDSR